MLQKLGTKLTGLTLVAILAGAFLIPAAQATPITFYNDAATLTTARFTVGCGSAIGDCSGKLEAAVTDTSPPAWSWTIGQMLGGSSNANPQSEMDFVNSMLHTVLSTAFTKNSGNITPTGNDPIEFSLTANYLLIKVGNGPTHQGYALLHNLGGNLDLWFTGPGQAGGLSHYITFGSGSTPVPTPVPEPAALGLFGLGALLIGGFLGLRRRYD